MSVLVNTFLVRFKVSGPHGLVDIGMAVLVLNDMWLNPNLFVQENARANPGAEESPVQAVSLPCLDRACLIAKAQ